MKPEYDYLIVGAGLFGATFARLATNHGLRCLVVDRRQHTGGNIWCKEIEGINVHYYGAHIFHTSDRAVWDFVTRMVDMNRYTNCPIAIAPDGNVYNLPFNMSTFNRIWGVRTPAEAMRKIEEQRSEAAERLRSQGASEPRNLEEQAMLLVGHDIFNLLIRGYTEKQWGRPCSELPPEIIRRLPVRLVYDNNYFNDSFQGIPVGGYNVLIDRLLEGTDVRLGTDYLKDRAELDKIARRVIYTGCLDEYFDCDMGHLQWRSVRFDTTVEQTPNYQGNAVVNYTSASVPYTRIIEHKHFQDFGQKVYDNPVTVISREYSSEWKPGMEPFYPINDSANEQLANSYRQRADALEGVVFGGRLAQYRYYDMAPVMAEALRTFANEQHLHYND